ncbi:hypothetical protein VP01_2204g3 [Puccinia sorghi]|uniref:Uncharacterized protein n=1 Tax=Puccinia sorghi TaxID=27349 RepID=A0A0L6V8U2_9BASI|nr:hypothetical protein VP01_2204g3 [Puccinia sorghi]
MKIATAYRLIEKKYMDVQNFEENTGAGIEKKSGAQTLYNLLETKFPCYHRLDVLFQGKANVMAMFEFDHSKPGDELRLLMDSNFKHVDDGVGAMVSDGEDDLEEAQLENETNGSNQQEPSTTSPHLPPQDEVHNSLCPPLLGKEGKPHPATGDGPIGNQSSGDGPIGNDLSNCLGLPVDTNPNQPPLSLGRCFPTAIGNSLLPSSTSFCSWGQSSVCCCIASSTTRTTDSNAGANSPSAAPKVSLAREFSSATNSQFHIIESHLSVEQVRLEQEDTQAAKRDQLEEIHMNCAVHQADQQLAREEHREAREDACWV